MANRCKNQSVKANLVGRSQTDAGGEIHMSINLDTQTETPTQGPSNPQSKVIF